MNNPSDKLILKEKFLTPDKAQFILPIVSGLLLSIILAIFGLAPLILSKSKSLDELKIYRQKKADLIPLKEQRSTIYKLLKEQRQQNDFIINLIAGKKDLRTFLSKLGNIANEFSIELIEIIPGQATRYKNPPINNNDTSMYQPKSFSDPLIMPGIEKYTADIILKGSFVNLVEFLRKIENLESIILAENIRIENIKTNPEEKIVINTSELKLKLSAYGRSKY